jgi:hypothetical protein
MPFLAKKSVVQVRSEPTVQTVAGDEAMKRVVSRGGGTI